MSDTNALPAADSQPTSIEYIDDAHATFEADPKGLCPDGVIRRYTYASQLEGEADEVEASGDYFLTVEQLRANASLARMIKAHTREEFLSALIMAGLRMAVIATPRPPAPRPRVEGGLSAEEQEILSLAGCLGLDLARNRLLDLR